MPSVSRSRLLTILRDRYYQWVPLSTRQKMRVSRLLRGNMLSSNLTPSPIRIHNTPNIESSPTEKLRNRPRVGIVIPTYNQLEQLKLCVGVLSWQTMKEFVIVVADDGSTDGTREWVRDSLEEPFWSNRLFFVTGGPHQGTRRSRAINLAIANMPGDVWLVVLLSPDVLLHGFSLAAYLDWHSRFPNSFLAGRVEWLPPMERRDIQTVINTAGIDELRKSVRQDVPLEQVPTTHNGPEYRTRLGLTFAANALEAEAKPMQRDLFVSLNVAYPPRLHWFVGGFDDQLCGAGYEDADFAERHALEEMEIVGVGPAYGLHLHREAAPDAEAQRNLDYLIRKYERLNYPADVLAHYVAQTNWRYWWHYNRERGAEMVSADGTLWAVNGSRTHRLQLPDAAWLTPLGFARYEVQVIAPAELDALENMGVASDPLGDGLDYLRPPQPVAE